MYIPNMSTLLESAFVRLFENPAPTRMTGAFLIARDRWLSVDEIAELADVHVTVVYEYLDDLVDAGLVAEDLEPSKNRYQLSEEGTARLLVRLDDRIEEQIHRDAESEHEALDEFMA